MALRLLVPDLIKEFDQRLENSGMAKDAIEDKDARRLFTLAAQSMVGVREIGGNNRGRIVSMINDTVGRPMGQPWCMNFVQACLAYAEIKTGIKSPLIATQSCDEFWVNTPDSQKVKRIPLPGAIVIWGHYTSDGKYKGGHTGIVASADDEKFYAYEGNTTGGVDEHAKVIRDGGGVYFTKRSMSGNGDMKIRGFAKPF